MWGKATFAAALWGQVSTTRAQCVFLAVIISFLTISGDVELNPVIVNDKMIHALNTADRMASNGAFPDILISDKHKYCNCKGPVLK